MYDDADRRIAKSIKITLMGEARAAVHRIFPAEARDARICITYPEDEGIGLPEVAFRLDGRLGSVLLDGPDIQDLLWNGTPEELVRHLRDRLDWLLICLA